MTALLEADRLYRFFHAGDDETLALQGVSLAVDAGEIVAVTGTVGIGQVDAAGVPSRSGRARRRLSAHRRPAAVAPVRGAARRTSRGAHRSALSAVQPRRAPLGGRNVAIAQRLGRRATAERVLDLLRGRAAEGAAVLLVTHSPEVASIAGREIRLRDGKVEA